MPWTPNGAEVAPLDYGIWVWFDQKLDEYQGHTEITNESDLLAALNDIHSTLPQDLVNKTVDSFPGRIDLLIAQQGAQFEH